MINGTPFLFGEEQKSALRELRERAAARPIDMLTVAEQIKTPAGKRQHMDRMNEQSVEIPFGYMVTFSIENGHPCGTCRHMSMSSPKEGRAPNPQSLWLIASELGFDGELSSCSVWIEELQRGKNMRRVAINVVQPISVAESRSV